MCHKIIQLSGTVCTKQQELCPNLCLKSTNIGLVMMDPIQQFLNPHIHQVGCVLDAARLSGILKARQKLGRTFDSDKLGGIAFKKNSKMTMCSAYEEAQTIVPASTGQHQHCTCSVLKIL